MIDHREIDSKAEELGQRTLLNVQRDHVLTQLGFLKASTRREFEVLGLRRYGVREALGFSSGVLRMEMGIICPSRTRNLSLPHVMRLDPKLASQITK